MNNKKIIGPAERDFKEDKNAFSLTNAASATECTGLIMQPPQNDDEEENYEKIYSYYPSITRNKAKEEEEK